MLQLAQRELDDYDQYDPTPDDVYIGEGLRAEDFGDHMLLGYSIGGRFDELQRIKGPFYHGTHYNAVVRTNHLELNGHGRSINLIRQ